MNFKLARKLILSLARSKGFVDFVSRHGTSLGAQRFVAGERLDEALDVIKRLNEAGLAATLDHLGESVNSPQRAREAAAEYVRMLGDIDASGVDSNVSVKLTQLGLDINRELCLENMRRILHEASQRGNFVRIDMEDSPRVPATVALFKEVRRDYDNVGLAIQAYLYRSEDDVRSLAPLNPNLRIVKGAYDEPPEVAFPRKKDVDENFLRLAFINLEGGGYTAVATHDERLIEATINETQKRGIPRNTFEFQMLYGIRPDLQGLIASRGFRTRVYVPYGNDWFPYFLRRLAERPANLTFFLTNLIKR